MIWSEQIPEDAVYRSQWTRFVLGMGTSNLGSPYLLQNARIFVLQRWAYIRIWQSFWLIAGCYLSKTRCWVPRPSPQFPSLPIPSLPTSPLPLASPLVSLPWGTSTMDFKYGTSSWLEHAYLNRQWGQKLTLTVLSWQRLQDLWNSALRWNPWTPTANKTLVMGKIIKKLKARRFQKLVFKEKSWQNKKNNNKFPIKTWDEKVRVKLDETKTFDILVGRMRTTKDVQLQSQVLKQWFSVR